MNKIRATYVYTSPKRNTIVCNSFNEYMFLGIKGKTRQELISEGWDFREVDTPFGFQQRTKNKTVDIKIVPLKEQEYINSIRKYTKYLIAFPWDLYTDPSTCKIYNTPEISFCRGVLLLSRNKFDFVSNFSPVRNLQQPKFFTRKNKAISVLKMLRKDEERLILLSVRVNSKNEIASKFKVVDV